MRQKLKSTHILCTIEIRNHFWKLERSIKNIIRPTLIHMTTSRHLSISMNPE